MGYRRTTWLLSGLLVLSAAAFAAGADEHETGRTPITAANISPPETWGGADNVVALGHLYLSEQPDSATLAVAAEHGVGVVINLREPAELDWDEESAARNQGLRYFNVPVSRKGPGFDAAALSRISAIVADNSDTRILLHCSSGNRAAAWLATHLVADHGMPVETAIDLARQAGLTHEALLERVRNYLSDGPGDGR